MLVHLAITVSQVTLVLLMIAAGIQSLLRPDADPTWIRRLFAITDDASKIRTFALLQIGLGILLALPALLGAPSIVSLLAGVAIFAMLLRRGSTSSGALGRPVRRRRRTAIATVAAVTLFMVWEGEDGLAPGVALTTNMSQWRAHEVEWQQRADLEAPKVGEFAPDFELQDPSGVAARAIRSLLERIVACSDRGVRRVRTC